MALEKSEFLAKLKERAKETRVSQEFQLTGLEIADILKDRKHKALYIKLAKQSPHPQDLVRLAKEVAEKKDVKRRGAYFMAIVTGKHAERPKSEIYTSKKNGKNP